MKNLRLNTKIKSILLFVFMLAVVNTAYSKAVVRVVAVQGSVFGVNEGITFAINSGDFIEDLSEIMTEEQAQVTYVDFYDHTYHMAGSTHVKIMNKMTELRSGHLWIKSDNKSDEFSVQTSNSNAIYSKGEFIVSYDNNAGKSQILVVNGNLQYSNLLEAHMKYEIGAGQFSFVDQKYEEGLPRSPTVVGFDSFKHAMGYFNGIRPNDKGFEDVMKVQVAEDKPSYAARKIASVDEKPAKKASKSVTKGKIIFLSALNNNQNTKARTPASVKNAEEKYYKKLLAKPDMRDLSYPGHPTKSHSPATSKANVRVFGMDEMDGHAPAFPAATIPAPVVMPEPVVAPVAKVEAPKSEPSRVPSSNMVSPETKTFEKSLDKEMDEQKRHPEELNQLIDELKNFREDFNKYY
ncbi:MAG: hypothetical protein JNM93_07465 [Bacteriovoracaceae bacterium]|nr:hypothetical protein [Bacteriovoracaceae bacterium]